MFWEDKLLIVSSDPVDPQEFNIQLLSPHDNQGVPRTVRY